MVFLGRRKKIGFTNFTWEKYTSPGNYLITTIFLGLFLFATLAKGFHYFALNISSESIFVSFLIYITLLSQPGYTEAMKRIFMVVAIVVGIYIFSITR